MINRPFRFGVQGGPFTDRIALRKHALNVEALGYDELFTADHIGVFQPDGPLTQIDPFLPLVVAAEATTTLRFGPLVLNNEFHVPSLLARAAATFDQLSGGRLVLGMGSGYAAVEHDAIGRPIRPPGERVSRFEESLLIVRSLLDTGAVDIDGDHESAHLDEVGLRPSQSHIPLLIGGHGPRMVRIAARLADIFQFTGLGHDAVTGAPNASGFAFDDVAERAAWLTEASGDRDIERSLLVQFTAVGDDAPACAELAVRFGIDADTTEHTPFSLSGSLDQVVDKLERLREALGVSHVVIRDPDGFAPVVAALRGR
jgi:probable F420-dependent oxidoreductase